MCKIFSPCDRKFIEVLEHLYEGAISGETWPMALELGLKLLTAYQRLYPVYDVNTALLLMKLGKLSWYVTQPLAKGTLLNDVTQIWFFFY